MKPSFALDFRDGAIALLHRTSRGWQQVGGAAFDAPDLTEALAYLRSTALGLSPRGLATKLLIPNDQILYKTIHAPGPDAAKRRRQIKAALEGATPYKVEDLIFDWWGSGPEVQVAVVAKETLAEAEGFAAEHRFNPVSFVAVPDNGLYLGEPFFGTTSLAASLLSEGEKVERDQDPVSVIARDYGRAETQVAEASVAAAAEIQAGQEPVPEPEPIAAPSKQADEAPKPAPAPAPPAEPEALVEETAAAAATADPIAPDAPMEAPMAESQPDVTPTGAESPSVLPDFAAAKLPPNGAAAFDMKAMAVDLVDEAPMALDVGGEAKGPEVDPVEHISPERPKSLPDDLPPKPAASMLAAFASRRASDAADTATPDTREAAPTDFAKAAAEVRARKTPAVGPAPAQRPTVPRPTLAKPGTSATASGLRDALPFPGRATTAPKGKSPASAATQGSAASKLDRNVVPIAKPQADAARAKPGTGKATGLDGRPLPSTRKPRYLGLVLTGLLLLALALVAAWSSFSLSQNDTAPAAEPVGNATASAPEAEALPTPEEEALADGQDLPLADDLAATETEVGAEPALEPAETAAAEPAPETGLTGESLSATRPGSDPQDEIFLAANDVAPQLRDPVVLAVPAATADPPPQLGAPPPPFGTVYAFDADGRIRPTPEGIITPEGVLLVEGSPKRVPPARPAEATPAVATTSPTVAGAAPQTFQADPALAGKKPRSRPEGLAAPSAPAQDQGQVVSPAPGLRFAEVRPQQRPASLTAPSGGADAALSGASLAATGLQQGNGIGLASSRKPLPRPDGMEQAVDAAVAAALQSGDDQTQTAEVAPEEEPEPEVESASPDIPTSASVAKQATDKNALNLSRVALIGIFGNSAGRYAMIRQPNGGIKKVKVGDSIDGGGRVAAITSTEVQYQKGGRMVTLTLPKG